METTEFKTAFDAWLKTSQDSLIKSDWKSVAKDYPFIRFSADDLPYTMFTKKVKYCRLAVISGAALYLRAKQHSFAVDHFEGDFTIRTIPRQIFTDDIEMCHEYADHKYARQDINTILPLKLLKEVEEAEGFGELADQHYSIYDFITNAAQVESTLAPLLTDTINKDEIDIAVFIPVSELGHQTMAILQRHLEKTGVSTVMLASNSRAISRLVVPRLMVVDCPDGAPLGEPGQIATQRELIQKLIKFVNTNGKPGAVLQSGYSWQDPFAS